MTITTGTGIPFPMPTIGTLGVIVAESPVTAVGHQVELGILLLVESSGPEVAPLA
jgi:hypothetical protein